MLRVNGAAHMLCTRTPRRSGGCRICHPTSKGGRTDFLTFGAGKLGYVSPTLRRHLD